ncbi:MAG: DNA starvation/stationary phase protection protein [Bacteroidales bacterium]|nr:DNA starvation/stationary phase protection protein [Bacteroidales bacterium]
MKTIEFTKLNAEGSKKVVEALQQLLADYQIFYTNLRGFHWNLKGKDFFINHAKFEELYDNAAEKVDEIAERILMLGGTPNHNFSDYLKTAKLKETGLVTDGDTGLKNVLESYAYFIESERNIIKLAEAIDDEATVAQMSDYIKEQEKRVWMLVSYFEK